jgi:type I restriction enzyme S subunit
VSTTTLSRSPIGDLVDEVSTWNPSRESIGTFRYVDIGSIDQNAKAIQHSDQIPCTEAPSRARQIVKAGDVLVSTVRPNLNAVARVPDELDGATASTGFCVLRPRVNALDNKYLFHWVKTPRFVSEMVRLATGASYPAVSDAIVKRSLIPLPPLHEQRRIAAILEQADRLKVKRRLSFKILSKLRAAIFLNLFGDPNKNERGWQVRTLREVSEDVWDIDHKMPKSVEGTGIPFISAKDLVEDGVSFDEVKMISAEDFRSLSRKGKPRRGDIIYSRIGVNLGKARVVDVDFDFLASYSCCTVRPKTDLIHPAFLCHLLDSPFILKQAQKGVRAIAVPDLGLGEIKNFRVIVPPFEIQSEFVRRIDELNTLHSQVAKSSRNLDRLSASLQYRAFQGEL